jgi:phage I-like protein
MSEEKQEAVVETPEVKPETKQDGTDFVDFAKDPPEKIEARFKRLYGHVKESERVLGELTEHNAKLAERLEKIEADGAKSSHAVEIGKAKAQLKQAIEKGDTDKQVELQTQLTSLQTRAIDKIEKAPLPEPPNFDVRHVREWAREVDESGQFRRPWALEGHPRYAEAWDLTKEISSQTEDVDVILSEVEKRMATGKKPAATNATVMTSQGRPPKDKSIQLTAEQKMVADRMGIGHDKYIKQLEALR